MPDTAIIEKNINKNIDKTIDKTTEKDDIELKEPSMYKVIFLNDNYTSMQIVVELLQSIFHKSAEEANRIMLDVHKKGKGIAGIYIYDIACTKMLETMTVAKHFGFPLKVIIEEE